MRNIIIMISVLITGICNSEEFNGKVLMRVNGHKYLMDDLLGRKINTLKNQREDAGWYSIKWYGTDDNEHSLSSGVYIIHISAQSLESDETFTKSQKVLFLK